MPKHALQLIREQEGISVKDLAAKAGLSDEVIYRFERKNRRGERDRLSVSTVQAIALALGRDSLDVFDVTDITDTTASIGERGAQRASRNVTRRHMCPNCTLEVALGLSKCERCETDNLIPMVA